MRRNFSHRFTQINADKKKMEENKSNLIKALFEQDDVKDEINLITEKIIGCAYKVSNALGCGFLEKVYENALAYELRKTNLKVEPQKKNQSFLRQF
jgi:hypothetical protein